MLSAHLLHDAEPPDSVSPDMRIESRDDNKVNPDFYKKLSHLSPMHVSFLNQVDITSWTSLPIPNQIAVQVIALYLNNDYQVIPLFNMDLFLRDLSRNQPYFCSSLLVSALLGWACVSEMIHRLFAPGMLMVDTCRRCVAGVHLHAPQGGLLEFALLP